MSGGPYREVADAPLPVDPFIRKAEAAERAARALTEAVVIMAGTWSTKAIRNVDSVVGYLTNYAAVYRDGAKNRIKGGS